MRSNIKCGVLNCHFNSRGVCEADSIEVRPQGSDSATSSLGTFCETFIPSEEDDSFLT